MDFCKCSIPFHTRMRRLMTTSGVYSQANVDIFSRIKCTLQRKCLASSWSLSLGANFFRKNKMITHCKVDQNHYWFEKSLLQLRKFSFDCAILLSLIKLWDQGTMLWPIPNENPCHKHSTREVFSDPDFLPKVTCQNQSENQWFEPSSSWVFEVKIKTAHFSEPALAVFKE